jgi:hypothetical protein
MSCQGSQVPRGPTVLLQATLLLLPIMLLYHTAGIRWCRYRLLDSVAHKSTDCYLGIRSAC